MVALLLSAGTVLGETGFDGVAVDGILADADLYRLVTCGAPPGGNCVSQSLRWKKPVVTLAILPGDGPLPEGLATRLAEAVDQAVGELNAVGSGIAISLQAEGPADISLRPTRLGEGTVLTETPGVSGPGIMGAGFMTVWSDGNGTITEASILISNAISDADLESIVLEEVMQSLGFLYDIEGQAYDGVSILSQTSNATTTIAGQDAALLRLHYPTD
jgi:hypothetical protein